MTFWSDVLDVLNEYGWARNWEEITTSEKHCLTTAIAQVMKQRDLSSEARWLTMNRVWSQIKAEFRDTLTIPEWNDHPNRTWSDVESLLKTLHEREISE